MGAADFEDVRIVELDVDATQPSASGSAMRLMHLTLSCGPPSGWSGLFDEQRRFPRHSMWRKAYVSARHIVVDCVPDEIERYHLRDLKEDVAAVNEKYRQLVAQEAAQASAKHQRDQEERDDLRSIADRLDFE